MGPDPYETHQDSSPRSSLSEKPPTSPQRNVTDTPLNDPAGNESSKDRADPHGSAPMDTTDLEPPTSSRMDLDISYSAPPLTPPVCCYIMETKANVEDGIGDSDLDSNIPDTDSWPSPPLTPDTKFWIPSSPDKLWPCLPSTCPPDTAGEKSYRYLPDMKELLSLGFTDTIGPIPKELTIPVSFSFSTDSSAPSTVGAGLTNLGNTCYLNSVLQCLTHTASLVDGLLSLNHPTPCDGVEGFCVLCALLDHINVSLALPGEVLSPDNIVNHLSYFSSTFRVNVQQDAHEFFLAFLDKLGSCFPNSENKEESSSHQYRNLVEEIFGGQVVGRISCGNCGHLSESYEPIIDLSLGIGDVNTLSSALESYTKVENVDYTCEKCKEGAQQKRIMLHRAPSIAVIQLKRFRNTERFIEKFDSYVEFPVELDLHPYTIDNPNNEELQYDLYAVLVHAGPFLHEGHYFCFVRSSYDVWHRLDDSQVTRELGNTVLSQEAYMMFYTKRGTPWMSTILESMRSFRGPSASHSGVAHDENGDAGERKDTDERFIKTESCDFYGEKSFDGPKQGNADSSSCGFNSTTPGRLLAKFGESLNRDLFNERTDILSPPSKNESHDQDQEIVDTSESDAAQSNSSGSELGTGANPSTDPKRLKLESELL